MLLSPRFRHFTFQLDGKPHSTAFSHAPGLAAEAQSLHLEMQFNLWLELTHPGCRAAGRISHIAFTDEERCGRELPPDTQTTWIQP